jgi:hypothetical protein
LLVTQAWSALHLAVTHEESVAHSALVKHWTQEPSPSHWLPPLSLHALPFVAFDVEQVPLSQTGEAQTVPVGLQSLAF